MADSTELRIVLVGGGQPAATGEGPPPLPSPGPPPVPAAGPPQPGNFPPGAQTATWRPGMPPPPVQAGMGGGPLNPNRPAGLFNPPTPSTSINGAGGGAFGAAAMAAGMALDGLTKAISFATEVIRMRSQVLQQELRGDFLGAQVSRDRNNARLASFIPVVGPLISSILNARAQLNENFINESGVLRDRANELGGFNGPLAARLARNRANAIRRNIAEAQFAGPELANLSREQDQLDAVQQQLRMLKEIREAQRLAAETRKQRVELERKRDREKAELPKEIRKAFEEALRNLANDPIRMLLQGLDLPEQEDTGQNVLDQLQNQQLNRPQFQGL